MQKTLITPKINPDLDGVACAYAYAQLLNAASDGNQYMAGIYGHPQAEAQFLLDKFDIRDGLICNPSAEFTKFILVDASDLKGMPTVIRPLDVVEVIDHRLVQKAAGLFPQAKIQIEAVGAAATLVWEKAQARRINLNDQALLLIYGAIFSNTLNRKSDLIQTRDEKAIKFITDKLDGFPLAQTIDEMFYYKTEYIKSNYATFIPDDFKMFDYRGQKLGIAQLEGHDLANWLNDQTNPIKIVLRELKNKNNLDLIFLTVADIKNGYNIFLAIDSPTQNILSQKLSLQFDDQGLAKNSQLLLRKQILPRLLA